MNTKVKVGIAAAIVAALVALIVLDQKTTPKDDAASRPAPGGEAITVVGTGADAPSRRLGEEEINNLLRKAESEFKPSAPAKAPSGTGIKAPEEPNQKNIRPATSEEYVIKEGDTFETIAQAKLGSKSYAQKIIDANPGMKPTALRVGKKIVIPAKNDVKEEPAVAKDPAPSPAVTPDAAPAPAPAAPKKPEPAAALATVDGKKVYTVQPGDSLSMISMKVYNTSRHYQKIYEANKDVIDDPNTLQVGSKLTMPELPSKPAATPNGGSAGTVATTNPAPVAAPAGAKVHQVSEGASLWKIAEKYAAEKKIGIHDMMKLIVAANPDKLKDESSLLRLGWQLIIPE